MLAVALLLLAQDRAPIPIESGPMLPTRLIYVPGVMATRCPSQADVQARVTQNLGVDPFVEPAQRYAMLVIEVEDDVAVRARAQLLDESYASLGERVIEAHGESCEELVAASALALAIALDPTRALASPLDPLPLAPTPPVPVAPVASTRPRVIVEDEIDQSDALTRLLPEGTNMTFGVGGQGGLLLTPGFHGGSHVTASLRGGWWGIGAELRNEFPGDLAVTTLISAMPCAHLGLFSLRDDDDRVGLRGCGVTSVGLGVSLDQTNLGGGPYVGFGARAGPEWALSDGSAVGLWFQLQFAPVRPVYLDPARGLPQSTSPVNLAFGATWEMGWPL